MKPEFKGVFPAPPTPIAEDGRIHEKALRALLDDNISHGCGGFWMAGSTGEGPMLTDEQRDAVAKISAEACKGRALVIMQVGAMSTASAVKAARTARSAGCAAVCCLPPLFFRSSEPSIIEYYRAVADAAGELPFFVYNLPQLTQVEFVPAMMEKLAREIPTLKGLKHSAPDFSQIRAFADMGLTCFSGNGAFPLPALTMGAVGTIDAPPSIAPWHYAEIFAAWEAGNMTLAQSLQDGVRKYVDLVWMFGAPADVCKTVLSARLGVDYGRSIPPVNRLTDEQRRDVLRAAEALGVTASRRKSVLSARCGGRARMKDEWGEVRVLGAQGKDEGRRMKDEGRQVRSAGCLVLSARCAGREGQGGTKANCFVYFLRNPVRRSPHDRTPPRARPAKAL